MNFSRGQAGTKVRCESRLFSQGKTPEFTKTGDIHELFVLGLSLVWFAGATPDFNQVGRFLTHAQFIPFPDRPSFVLAVSLCFLFWDAKG